MISRALWLLPLFALVPTAFGQTHFHHVHLNSADPQKAIQFFTEHLAADRAKFDGQDALWTQKSWILLNKVKQPPLHDAISGLFHIGWGAEDMKEEFARQIRLGTTFQTILTDAVELFGTGSRDRNFFMYLDGPDHLTIEVQSAMNHNFMHVHMFSDDPVGTAEWYQKHFSLPGRGPASRAERVYRSIPTGPLGSVTVDNVSILWYPTAHARTMYGAEWKGRSQYASPRGRVFDHIAFSVDSLDATVARLKQEGVKVIGAPKKTGGLRSVFVEAPDNVELELVEGQAVAPK